MQKWLNEYQSSSSSLLFKIDMTLTYGGEKGVPLCIQIDTYENNIDNNKDLYSCCCKIQLFH